MKKILLLFLSSLMSLAINAQGMSDSQVLDYMKSHQKAGASQSQIVTGLMQRGVKIDQIRRLRDQYQDQMTDEGKLLSASEDRDNTRLNANNDGTEYQQLNTAKVNTTGEVYADADEDHDDAELDVQSESTVAGDINGKRIFGHDIFRTRGLTFEPNSNLPAPQNYVLGPGDVLVVDIYGASQRAMSLTVSPEGTVRIPDVGPVSVSGLTVAAAQSRLRATLGARYQSSNLKLTVSQHRTIMINVMGAVSHPGTYHLSSFATVFYALYQAGGISQLGTLRNIKVVRGGRVISHVDIYDFILTGKMTGNIRLQDDDVIQVGPYENVVGISGNVKRPMFYEMKKGESVATLLGYAGGFTSGAHKSSIRLQRQSGERYEVYNVGEFDFSTFTLEDGDVLTVDGMLNRYENMVEVKGAVFRPGQFQLGGNVTTVRNLVLAADGLTEDAFASHAVLHRLKADRTLEVVPVDLQGIMDGTVADIPLKNEDVLFVMTQEDLRQERTLTITGEVMSPGTYEFADNTTIEDLIVMAGGLTDQASLTKVDVSRRIRDPKATTKNKEIAKSFTFELKDGLVIDGARSFILEPYDIVHVRRSPAFHTPRNIRVTGEVNYEGNFTLENKNMRLTDALAMAGGFTDAAYLRGARLTRTMNDEERIRMRASMEAIRNILTERGDSIDMTGLQNSNTYTIGIELDKAVANPGCDYDMILREGDQIFVPEYNGTVKISGDVMFPNTVSYIDGKNYKNYIEQAGGFGNQAKKSKTFIVYQNGTIGMAKKGAKPEPGCEIIVPSKKRRDPIDWINVFRGASSLVSLATLVVALTKL
ncbi:MAG: SLBB domain-containing protein [Prevotella sp.]|nr:SLBB domain-containing protein [Prevotella sp.]